MDKGSFVPTPTRRRQPRARHGAQRQRGQSLVEFALVFPIFWAVLIGLVEFSFLFQSVLAVSFASRNAAVIGAEAGNAPTADCSILHSVEGDLGAPSVPGQIQKVDISWTDSNGVAKAGATTTYTRSTSSTIACTVNGVSYTLPYVLTINGYPIASRCSTRTGCAGHSGLDTIGVQVTYAYIYHTPYGAVLGGTGMTLVRSSEMRLEPFQ
jgi:Flp pilus assembly protein TadG